MNANTVTKDQLAAGFSMVAAVAEAVRELKQVPSGHLYARVMGHLDLPAYEKIVGILKGAGLVTEQNHMLTWCGPQKEVA